MTLPYVIERIMVGGAQAAWPLVRALNRVGQRPNPTPKWSPTPLPSSCERSRIDAGWPRTTDSLCPTCVKEIRQAILTGELDLKTLTEGHHGEIKAQIVERDGVLRMEKTCPKHGHFSDVLSIDPAFTRRIEQLDPGRDPATPPSPLRNHGTSSIRYGRGSVLTIDLTNRCNMMCEPCFTDANQVGTVHEPTLEEIRKILDDAASFKPHRQLSIQFSGGEPTLSPHFLDAIAYARQLGFFCVQAATNGIRFAQEPGFAQKAHDAGMRLAYLQFDGVGNEAHLHRKVTNLFDVKLRAIEELSRAGIDVVLVVTLINGLNNHQVGKIVEFAIQNADKVSVVSFQPIAFTGRDGEVDDETRERQRYTLSHLAHDVKAQTGLTEPLRDWFPLSSLGPFSDFVDRQLGLQASWGSMRCGCHPDCGAGTVLFVNKHTKEMIPLSAFINMEQLLRDVTTIADASQGRKVSLSELAIALLRNYQPEKAPHGYDFISLIKQLVSQMGARGDHIGASEGDSSTFDWRILFVAGMWFQDLFNFDFRRTEMCIIPYGTPMGEISFCAYNSGIGWRQIVEQRHAKASIAEWYRTHGRHTVYANRQPLTLPEYEHPLTSQVPDDPDYVDTLNAKGKVHLRVVA